MKPNLYRIDVQYIGTDADYKQDRYLVRVLDAKDDAEYARCTWIGRQSDALKVGVRMAEAYKKGYKDGPARRTGSCA